ncbi:MAG TPA: hypothetical protein VM509_15955 [Planctomycetota bacterium]|nr:hypothetical protein [Planctomycetota bacterium]
MRNRLPACLAALFFVLFSTACAVTNSSATRASVAAGRSPVFDARVRLAGGKYEHDIDGSLQDKTSAGHFGLLAEGSTHSGIGGGISLEVTNSDDDLFENQIVDSDQATLVEIDPFFLYRVRGGDRFQMPLRFGPWIHVLTLDDQGSSDELTWVSLGLRLEVEPEVVLARTDDFEFSLFTALSLAGGGTEVHLDSSGGDEDFDTDAGEFGFEIGPRFRWSHFEAGFSFLHRAVEFDESDPENNVTVRGVDATFNALAVSFGGGF